KQAGTGSGLRSGCKECLKVVAKEYKSTEVGRLRLKANSRRYCRSDKGRLAALANTRKYYKRHPKKVEAWNTFKVAIRSGSVVRPNTCEKCGVECRPEGHHPDYSRPLEVVFVCRRCHVAIHREDAE
ncbi:MAG: hypothetical protein V3T77_09090, partial [Planctomycetota bacterium]